MSLNRGMVEFYIKWKDLQHTQASHNGVTPDSFHCLYAVRFEKHTHVLTFWYLWEGCGASMPQSNLLMRFCPRWNFLAIWKEQSCTNFTTLLTSLGWILSLSIITSSDYLFSFRVTKHRLIPGIDVCWETLVLPLPLSTPTHVPCFWRCSEGHTPV